MSKILITGGNGFLGRNLIDFLLTNTDHEIVTIVRPKVVELSSLNKKLKIIYHDLRTAFGNNYVKDIRDVDYVIHFAGATNTKKSIDEPMSFIMDNVIGTANLLEHVRHNSEKIKQFLYFSTAEIFGHAPTGTIFKENDTPNPSSPYAATKIAAQELCIAYKNIYNIPITIVYAMNIFGPHQSLEKFIPLMVKKIIKEEKVDICLNIESSIPNRRNYLHVHDLCNAIMFLLKHGLSGEKYNIGAKKESDNLKIAKTIAKLLNKKLDYRLIASDPRALALPRLNVDKIYDLGWSPQKTLEEGLKEIIESEYGKVGETYASG